jgi:hypothetical protein
MGSSVPPKRGDEVWRVAAGAGPLTVRTAAERDLVRAREPGTLSDVPPNAVPSSAFDLATAVTRAEGGGLVADLDPAWDVGGGVLNGGYLLAVAGRAAVLDSPHPHPVALSASYLRAPAAGPASRPSSPGRPAARWPTRWSRCRTLRVRR